MSHERKLAHQWLAVDAALGVTEVPVGRSVLAGRPKVAAAKPAVATVARAAAPPLRGPANTQVLAAAPAASSARVSTPRPASVPAAEPAVPRVAKPRPQGVAPPPAKALPPIPDGNIADESPQDRTEKVRRLAALAAEVDLAMAPFISEIATRVVFGEGDPAAPIMFVGEGPGLEEDRTGRPFVGRSGQLLDKMILAMGFTRETVYIGNICKLRAASWDEDAGRIKDRPPTLAEAALGLPWLHRQIAIIGPRVIVTLGATAIRYLIGEMENMSMVRGHWRQYRGIPVMPTYHPSYLLRAYSPENRGKVWSDLQAVMQRVKDTSGTL